MQLVEKLGKHSIYYVSDNNIKYYINVPNKEFNVTNISLEFLENTDKYDPDKNDLEWIKSNVIEYYRQIDDSNITLAMPILKPEEKKLFILLDNNNNTLNYIEKIMALYINSCYHCLVKNNIEVNREVFLIENDKFQNFIRYFKNNHNSRIIVKGLMEVINDSNDSLNNNSNLNANNNTPINDNTKNVELEKKEKVPFSLNENALNTALNNNNPINPIVNEKTEAKIENNVPIQTSNNDVISKPVSQPPIDNKINAQVDTNINNTSPEQSVNSNISNEKNMNAQNINSQNVQNNDINNVQNSKPLSINDNAINNVNSNSLFEAPNDVKIQQNADKISIDNNNSNNLNNSNDLKVENGVVGNIPKNSVEANEQKVKKIITPKGEISDKATEVKETAAPNITVQPNIVIPASSNILDLNDLGKINLADAGITGGVPNNVTINIERVVTDNAKPKRKKDDDYDDDLDEKSELDEDISDYEDDLDEDEDFDLDAIDVSEAVFSNDDGNKKYRTITSGGVKFVVGRIDDENLQPIDLKKPDENIDLKDPNLVVKNPTNVVKNENQANQNAGFASYFILFFVSIFALALIMYIVIK